MAIADLIPTAEELFERPYPPAPPLPPAWDAAVSIAAYLADRECARLLVNCCLFDPPITEEEIDNYARRFGLPKNQAEEELRKGRRDGNG